MCRRSPFISPSLGALSVSTELSQNMMTYLEPEGNTSREARGFIEVKSDAYFRRLLKINAPEWRHAIFAIFGCILTGLCIPFGALVLAAVAGIYYTPDYDYLRKEVRLYAIYFAIIASGGMIGYIMQEYFWGYVNENLTKRVRERMLASKNHPVLSFRVPIILFIYIILLKMLCNLPDILKNEISWFDKDENSSSHLSARLASDAATIRTALGTRVSLLLSNLTVLTVASIICFVLSWKMTLVTLAVFPLAVVAAVAEVILLLN